MEKIFTLLKTLTAFRDLLFTHSNKSVDIVNNKQTSVTGCRAVTALTDKSFYRDDAKQDDASFLLFEQAQHSGEDKKVKAKEDTDNAKKTNDELALGSSPNPVHTTWRERVNDDLAACTAVDNPLFPPINSIKRKNENIIDHIFFVNDTTTINNKTKASKDDAFLPFASFSFLCKKFSQSIFNAVELSTTQKLILVRIPIKKSFVYRRTIIFNQKNQSPI